jgi:hypothetical protein
MLAQIWASQPDKYLLRSRLVDTNALIYQEYILGNLSFISSTPGDSLDAQFIEGDANPTLNQITWSLAPLLSQENEIELKVIGEEQTAGRRAIVVDLYDQEKGHVYRLWVDAVTGTILRRLIYSPSSPEVVLWEEQITAIVYDQAFPPEVFNPVAPPQFRSRRLRRTPPRRPGSSPAAHLAGKRPYPPPPPGAPGRIRSFPPAGVRAVAGAMGKSRFPGWLARLHFHPCAYSTRIPVSCRQPSARSFGGTTAFECIVPRSVRLSLLFRQFAIEERHL